MSLQTSLRRQHLMMAVRMFSACTNSHLVQTAKRYVFRPFNSHPTLNFLFIQFNVSLPRKGPPAPGARPPKTYKMKLTKVAVINTEYDPFISNHDPLIDPLFRLLHRFIAGQQSQDPAILTAIMVSFVACIKKILSST